MGATVVVEAGPCPRRPFVRLRDGIALRRMRFGITALAVFRLALLKVFFYDLSFLSGQYRTFSFGALGLVLIGVAVLYGRYRDVIFGGREELEDEGGADPGRSS
jgi:hypothetical protein